MQRVFIAITLILLTNLPAYVISAESVQAQADTLRLDPERIQWTKLFYQANSFWVDAATTVYLKSLATNEVKASLIQSRQGNPLPVPNSGCYKITTDATIDTVFQPPVTILNHVWFDPTNASALGRARLRQGEDDFKKVYRFTNQGVFRHRREPLNKNEAKQKPEKWSDTQNNFYPYNPEQLECPDVSERLVLIFIASASELLAHDKSVSICVFGKRQLFRVQMQSAGLHTVKVDYFEKKGQDILHRQSNVKARKISIMSQPLPSNLDKEENFSFLGFHKNIAIYIDPTSNLPVQVSGDIPTVGQSTFRLKEVTFKSTQ